MHPEIVQDKPGRCPKCHMRLVEKGSPLHIAQEANMETATFKTYLPLLVIFCLIFLTSLVISLGNIQTDVSSIKVFLSSFMAGFFLVFAGFKLMDLPGFAEGYATYDLLAKRVFAYGYVYPFIELFFGLSMILFPASRLLLVLEFAVMVFSGIGVAQKLAKKEKFQCACLGTFFKVPLTKVTLIEDFGMALLALILLFL